MRLVVLCLILSLNAIVFAQDGKTIQLTKVEKIRKHSHYTFVIPDGTTKLQLEEKMAPYISYMNLKFINDGTLVLILKEEDEINKRVLFRYLMSFGIANIKYKGETMTLEQSIQQFVEQ